MIGSVLLTLLGGAIDAPNGPRLAFVQKTICA